MSNPWQPFYALMDVELAKLRAEHCAAVLKAVDTPGSAMNQAAEHLPGYRANILADKQDADEWLKEAEAEADQIDPTPAPPSASED